MSKRTLLAYVEIEPLIDETGDPAELLRKYPKFNPTAGEGKVRRSLLEIACVNGDIHIAKGLVRCGARLGGKFTEGLTLLQIMIGGRCPVTLAWLLTQADVLATIDARYGNGMTAFHIAVKTSAVDTRMLIDCGANPTLKDKEGRTAAEYALSTGVRHAITPHRTAIWFMNADETYPMAKKAEQAWASIEEVGEWRPCNHRAYPRPYRLAMRSLALLAKSCT
ncbi:MAG: ankyrin repeat domain-containing protein [Phycisphaeraceae bacterium]|nr:ankyrin repeat domain-containing protein [Phycisphaeraceae bacterium]